MDAIKAFLAKDIVKIIGGAVWIAVAALLAKYITDINVEVAVLGIWTSIGVALGFASGGTSNLRSNASNEATQVLQQKGIVPPVPPK